MTETHNLNDKRLVVYDNMPFWKYSPAIFLYVFSLFVLGVAILVPEYAQFLLLAPVILAGGLVIMVRPEISILLVVGYLPFESPEFKLNALLPFGLSIGKISGLILLASFLFNILARGRRFRILDDKQDHLILLMAAAFLLSGIVSSFPGETLSSSLRMIRMFIFYFCVKNLIPSIHFTKYVMWTMLLTGTYASAFGINHYLDLKAIRTHDPRVGGIYMDPNGYAALAVVVTVVGIHLFELYQKFWVKIFIFLCTAITILGILLSGSRGGLLSFGIIMAVYLWRHPRRLQFSIIIISVMIVSFPIWPSSITTRLFGSSDGLTENISVETSQHSLTRRLAYVDFGIELFTSSPILGVGYGNFSHLFPKSKYAEFSNPLTQKDSIRVSHNTYLEIAVGTGIVGLIVFLLIWYIAWHDLFIAGRRSGWTTEFGKIAKAFELSWISLLITSFFLTAEAFDYIWLIFAISSVFSFYDGESNNMEKIV